MLLSVLGLALVPARGFAQQTGACDLSPDARADEVALRPADGAEHVARDAPIIARYPLGSDLDALRASVAQDSDPDCRGRVICLFRQAGSDAHPERVAVAGEVQALDADSLAFVPRSALAADSDYFALVARPGFDTASRTELAFQTGSALDREPPELEVGADALELDVEPPPAECDAADGSLRVRVAAPAAHDDGDEESVELLLFVTRAAGLHAPELRARALNRPGDSVALTFMLDPVEAAAAVCVALRAVDGSGKPSEGQPELCFQPAAARDSQFQSLCALARPHRGPDNGRGLLVASALVVAALARRSTRRSRTRSRAH